MQSVPSIDSIDLDWVCAQVGGIPNAVSMTKTKFGTGQGGRCYRLSISTSDGGCRTFVVKCPSLDQKSLQTSRMVHLYEKEVTFYRILAPQLPIRTPKCYFAQRDEDDNFLLLLEDLAPSTDVKQWEGISLEVAKRGLRELAGLHGSTFMKTEPYHSWIRTASAEVQAMRDALLNMFINTEGKQLDETTLRALALVKRHYQERGDDSYSTSCIIHRDFRTDNLLIDARNGEVPIATVDWQTIDVGSPMFDVQYFLITSLTIEDCARHENDLIDYYLECLREFGVDYSREDARRVYAFYIPDTLMYAVYALAIVEKTDRGDHMLREMFRKSVAAFQRWQTLN